MTNIDHLTVNSQLVLLYVRDNRGWTEQEVCEFLSLSPDDLCDALAELQEHGLLTRPS